MNDFEQQLRERSLGSGPHQRDRLMYQCGYSAGVAATRKQSQLTTTRWRLVGLAASVLACCSLSYQFLSNGDIDGRTEVVNQSASNLSTPNRNISDRASTMTWISQLSRDRRVDPQFKGILRASETVLTSMESEEGAFAEPVGSDSSSSPLRPSDFPLFL